jgi:multicomponent Na+:H+ antiporter subunit A
MAVTVTGAATMVVGAYRAAQETDLKRVLAYSTLSALGVLTMLLGVGTREAITAALVYLVAHAGYKGALFLVAGVLDHEVGTRDITALGGLYRKMPVTAYAGGAAALSMAGVPLTMGFVGKDGAYEALLHASDWLPWLLILIVLASIFLGLAGLIAGVRPFHGNAAPTKDVHDPEWQMWLPPLVLATGGLLAGIAPSILNRPLSSAATAVAGGSVDVSLRVWHGVTLALLLSVLTLAAVGLAYAAQAAVRTRTWKPRHGTEDVYNGALSALTAVSRAIAPALHSASLRTYVMVIVATSALIGSAALLTAPGFGTAVPHTSVTVHDLLIVFVIIAGAIAATVARSTMSAVLALGAVGLVV